jgi:hypothetical protein
MLLEMVHGHRATSDLTEESQSMPLVYLEVNTNMVAEAWVVWIIRPNLFTLHN